jgi:hypothetical protein
MLIPTFTMYKVENIKVDNEKDQINVNFTPTIPHCR